MRNSIFFRIIKDSFFKTLVIFISFLSTLPLLFILLYILKNGISSINWEFFVNLPKPVGESGGGISNAAVGTVLLTITSSLFSVPLGIFAGIYLSEYKDSKLSYWVRLCVEVLQGIPSIVIGIIAHVWIVVTTGTLLPVPNFLQALSIFK